MLILAQEDSNNVKKLSNEIFRQDAYWRGADGAATVPLNSGKVLWLFSDTFIDQDGTGRRSNARKMIRNSIAVQDSADLSSGLVYYYRGEKHNPSAFFEFHGENWFWTGHGIPVQDKLVIFLMEITSTKTGLGFEAVGWHTAIIENPCDTPDQWRINYHRGPDTFGVIVGISGLLQDDEFVYAFGVKEPATHETYLLRFKKVDLAGGKLDKLEWWVNNGWKAGVYEEPVADTLFTSQTEFSVHFEEALGKYVQIQTFGFGKASIGYRLADQLYGPWSDPVIIWTPQLKHEKEFVYSANAHPELRSGGLIVTYNINNFDFGRLLKDEEIYYPEIIEITFNRE